MAGPYDPESIEDFAAGWPPQDIPDIKVAKTRLFVQLMCARVLTMLSVWTSYAGQVIAVNSAGTGPTAAGASGLLAILFGNKGVRGFKFGAEPVTGSVVLTDNGHGGAVLMAKNTSPITVTLSPTGDPDTGCSTGFTCEVFRCVESTAPVQVVFSSCTNRNPDGHTRVKAGRNAVLKLDGANAYFYGYTEA
ncbi:MAG: hypothetical protein WAS21_06775 [Geminicoccaceae bacterium]